MTTRGDLNEVEAENVGAGYQWLAAGKHPLVAQMDTAFVSELHRRLFGDVWSWAGRYRTFDTNIGPDWFQIPAAVKQLVDDFAFRLVTPPASFDLIDAECVEYHHRMVRIHLFTNGNGRHARACADAAAVALGRPPFTWGGASIINSHTTRRGYIDAIRAADDGDLTDLNRFARS